MRHVAAAVVLTLAAAPANAAGVPEVIKARVNTLVATCAAAGGQLGAMDGQGRFVIPADFNGDGRTDFIVSEGNFPCVGQPALFRAGGQSRLELYLGDGSVGARLVFADRLIAYRILAGSPARLQIARQGAGCGGGAQARCGAELKWNAAANRFDEAGTGASGGAAVAALRPAVIDGGAPAPASQPAGPAAAPLPVLANARELLLADCRKDLATRYPKMTRSNIDSFCIPRWDRVVAAGPIADAMLAAVPARPGEAVTLAALKTRLPQARWLGAAKANTPVGQLGKVEIAVDGATTLKTVTFRWSGGAGAEPAYDLPGALAARGATVKPLGCYDFGAAEVDRVYVVTAPGRPPFGLETYDHAAAVASQATSQSMAADLSGRVPTVASLSAQYRDPAWQPVCEF